MLWPPKSELQLSQLTKYISLMDHGSHVADFYCDWLCNGQCQKWSIPCNGNCPNDHFLNCENECEERILYKQPPYMCGQECYESWRPCNGSCNLSGWLEQKCYGQDACLTYKYLWKCPTEYRSNVGFTINFDGELDK